jgi:hypothetical protein
MPISWAKLSSFISDTYGLRPNCAGFLDEAGAQRLGEMPKKTAGKKWDMRIVFARLP